MHVVLQHILHLYRTEGSKSHMQRHISQRYAFFLNLRKQLRCEVKPCGGRRSRTVVPGVNGLIPRLVLQPVRDIRGKRHLSEAVQNLLKDSLIGKTDQAVSLLHNLKHLSPKQAVPEDNPCPRLHLFSRLYQGFPYIVLPPFQKKHLYGRFRVLLHSKEPCRNYTGIVQHKTVARTQIIRKITESFMPDLPGFFVHDQEPGGRSVVKGILGDELRGKFIIKIRSLKL